MIIKIGTKYMAKKATQIYQIKVTLDDTHPPIWRRIQVAGHTTAFQGTPDVYRARLESLAQRYASRLSLIGRWEKRGWI
jgi:hypothetical protein